MQKNPYLDLTMVVCLVTLCDENLTMFQEAYFSEIKGSTRKIYQHSDWIGIIWRKFIPIISILLTICQQQFWLQYSPEESIPFHVAIPKLKWDLSADFCLLTFPHGWQVLIMPSLVFTFFEPIFGYPCNHQSRGSSSQRRTSIPIWTMEREAH